MERIGVHSWAIYQQVTHALPANGHRPPVEIRAGLVLLNRETAIMIEFRSGDILKERR